MLARLDLLRRVPKPSDAFQRVGWATVGHAGSQVIRFASNLVLTRLLAPELFGIMVLLTSIRVGLELFTDIGIGQNIVANRGATTPQFYNTAWTIQVIRGGLLALVAIALLPVLGRFYNQEQLNQVLPFVSLFFIITGFNSIGLPLALKALDTKRVAVVEIASSIASALMLIVCAVISSTIWGLLVGNLLGLLMTTLLSYLVRPGIQHRFVIDRAYLGEIIGLGKWIFISSIVYFLATNFDRLMLAKYVTFTALGLYGLARVLGDVFGQFAGKLGAAIVFPSVSSSGLEGPALRAKLSTRRFQLILLATLAMAPMIAGADFIIGLLYDPRYSAAATILPWVAVAAWLSILNSLNENVLLGLRLPAYMAFGNAAKLLLILVALPPFVIKYGVVGAAAATILGELGRYGPLAFGKYKEGVGFFLQDLLATVALCFLVLLLRVVSYEVGLTGSLQELFVLARV